MRSRAHTGELWEGEEELWEKWGKSSVRKEKEGVDFQKEKFKKGKDSLGILGRRKGRGPQGWVYLSVFLGSGDCSDSLLAPAPSAGLPPCRPADHDRGAGGLRQVLTSSRHPRGDAEGLGGRLLEQVIHTSLGSGSGERLTVGGWAALLSTILLR